MRARQAAGSRRRARGAPGGATARPASKRLGACPQRSKGGGARPQRRARRRACALDGLLLAWVRALARALVTGAGCSA
jgi:hypothetical protein